MALARLQQNLERLYDVSVGRNVEDFLVHDPALVRRIENNPAARDIPEKLLLRETEDNLDIALYLEKELVERLQADDPTERLHTGNLADFLTALEGVSHFLCVVWSATHERSVSLLELELQAEIDKFILSALLIARHANGRVPSGLHRLLFDEAAFDPVLDDFLAARYQAANHYARRYCAWLQKHFLAAPQRPGMMHELRRFYRLGHHGKLARIRHDVRH